MKYAVETLFTYGWENCWLDENERLLVFSTREEAVQAIRDHVATCLEEVDAGNLEDAPDPSELRVVEVQ